MYLIFTTYFHVHLFVLHLNYEHCCIIEKVMFETSQWLLNVCQALVVVGGHIIIFALEPSPA